MKKVRKYSLAQFFFAELTRKKLQNISGSKGHKKIVKPIFDYFFSGMLFCLLNYTNITYLNI
jgi:hypothetical protein